MHSLTQYVDLSVGLDNDSSLDDSADAGSDDDSFDLELSIASQATPDSSAHSPVQNGDISVELGDIVSLDADTDDASSDDEFFDAALLEHSFATEGSLESLVDTATTDDDDISDDDFFDAAEPEHSISDEESLDSTIDTATATPVLTNSNDTVDSRLDAGDDIVVLQLDTPGHVEEHPIAHEEPVGLHVDVATATPTPASPGAFDNDVDSLLDAGDDVVVLQLETPGHVEEHPIALEEPLDSPVDVAITTPAMVTSDSDDDTDSRLNDGDDIVVLQLETPGHVAASPSIDTTAAPAVDEQREDSALVPASTISRPASEARQYSPHFPEGYHLAKEFLEDYELTSVELDVDHSGFRLAARSRRCGRRVSVKFFSPFNEGSQWVAHPQLGSIPYEAFIGMTFVHHNIASTLR